MSNGSEHLPERRVNEQPSIFSRLAELGIAAKLEYEAKLQQALAELKRDFGIDRPLNEHGQLEVSPEELDRIKRACDAEQDLRLDPRPIPTEVGIPIVVVRDGQSPGAS